MQGDRQFRQQARAPCSPLLLRVPVHPISLKGFTLCVRPSNTSLSCLPPLIIYPHSTLQTEKEQKNSNIYGLLWRRPSSLSFIQSKLWKASSPLFPVPPRPTPCSTPMAGVHLYASTAPLSLKSPMPSEVLHLKDISSSSPSLTPL